ncbi:MAG: hypothetical protein IKA61_06770 [Clostridia bacterium]|nr:hypothetical protein [Clostridia bacterium]
MKKLHLICNAHVDPIWQWTLDEGISSAIATFKSAVDLAEEFDYIFCHNESFLYEKIEECAPDLFEKIKVLVKKGKWKIVGGWYLQPDCNLPSGETFVRHVNVGKKYFKEKFGVEPNVALNFDAFGHSVGLVQILAKNGYKGYMACRPGSGFQYDYPGRFFKWTSPDGSEVIATNNISYGTLLGDAASKIYHEATGGHISMLGQDGVETSTTMLEDVNYSLWGVGNHGGGPSRKDLRDIANLRIDDTVILHSTPEDLFNDDIKISGEVNESLVTCMPGCYSSMARVKQAYRRTENLFYATEKMIALASLNGYDVDLNAMKEAEKNMLLATFHDVLPGTCTENGEREGLCALSSAEKILRDYRSKIFLRLASSQKHAGEKEFPVFVFNYSPYKVTTPVEVEFSLENQNWDLDIRYNPHVYFNGVEIPCQQIKEESTLTLDWRKKVVFSATLEPLSLTRFEIKVSADKRESTAIAKECDIAKMLGYKPIFELYDDSADPWAMSAEELKAVGKNPRELIKMTDREVKDFCALQSELGAERIIEDGALFTCYEGLYSLDNSNVVAQIRQYKNFDFTDYKIVAEFADKNKLLRVKIPVPNEFCGGELVGDGPYVWEKKPSCEVTFQKWIGIKKGDKIFSIINDGIYSGKYQDGYLHLTLLRGAGYCFHPIPNQPLYPEDRYLPRIDCGRYEFNLRVYQGSVNEVCKMAEEFNQKPYAVNVFPVGDKTVDFKQVELSGNVLLVNLHKNDNGEIVARLYNPSLQSQEFSLKLQRVKISDKLSKAEVLTVVFKDGNFELFHNEMPV